MASPGSESVFRIGRGWQLRAENEICRTLVSGFIRPAVHAIPPEIIRQLGPCRVSLVQHVGSASVASQWTLTEARIEISLAVSGRDGHDIALELLVCLGQALWERLDDGQRTAYWLLLDHEIAAGIPGEIDEEAFKQKRLLLSNRSSATSRRRLERYGSASFAGTAAEYVHSLWHDVSVRKGSRHLPAEQLRRRLELLARWYPPRRGQPLFPPGSPGRKT